MQMYCWDYVTKTPTLRNQIFDPHEWMENKQDHDHTHSQMRRQDNELMLPFHINKQNYKQHMMQRLMPELGLLHTHQLATN